MQPSALDFGEVWIADSHQVAFDVTNTSDVPIEIVEIRTSCVCTGVDPEKFILEGNGRRTITLKIDLANLAEPNDKLVVPFETVLRPLMKDQSRFDWTVTGRVRLPFALPGGYIDLGEITDEPRKGEFTLRRHPDVSEIAVATSDPNLSVRLIRRGEAGEPDKYEVLRSHEVPLGAFRSPLQITATAIDGTVIRPIEVFASGVLVGEFSWSPQRLVITSDQSGSQGEVIVIQSRSGTPFVVESISSPNVAIQADVIPTPEQSTAAVRVRLQEDATAINLNTKILISVKDSRESEEQFIEVPVTAFARATKEARKTASR